VTNIDKPDIVLRYEIIYCCKKFIVQVKIMHSLWWV